MDTRNHGCDRDEVCARLDSVTISQNITESTVDRFIHNSPCHTNVEEATLGLIKTKKYSQLFVFISLNFDSQIFFPLCVNSFQ